MLTPLRFWCTELTKMFCTALESPDTDSTKNTRCRLAVSPNTPGLTRDTSSRDSSLRGVLRRPSAPPTAR